MKHGKVTGQGTTSKVLAGIDLLYWTLPSGQRLPEFALCAGFAAPLLLSRSSGAQLSILSHVEKVAAMTSSKAEEGV